MYKKNAPMLCDMPDSHQRKHDVLNRLPSALCHQRVVPPCIREKSRAKRSKPFSLFWRPLQLNARPWICFGLPRRACPGRIIMIRVLTFVFSLRRRRKWGADFCGLQGRARLLQAVIAQWPCPTWRGQGAKPDIDRRGDAPS